MTEPTPPEYDSKYTSASQQRLLTLLGYLAEHPLESFEASALAATLGESVNATWRDLKNLEAGGWAEQCATGWRVSPSLTRFSERLRLNIAALHHTYLAE